MKIKLLQNSTESFKLENFYNFLSDKTYIPNPNFLPFAKA